MERFLWRIGYTVRLVLSPYGFTLLEAWNESQASWDCHVFFSPDWRIDMPTPADALYMDQTNWADL